MTNPNVRNIDGLPIILGQFDDFARATAKRLAAEAGYTLVDGSFEKGAVVTTMNDVVFYETDGKYYGWGGTLPKTVGAGSTPATSGGIGAGAWVDRTDVVLRDQLAESTGATKVGTSDGRTVEQRLAAIPNEVETALWDELAESTGATKVGTSDGRTVEQRLAAIPNEVENLLCTDEVKLGGSAASVPLDLGLGTSSFLWLANGVNITSVVISNATSIRVGQEFTLRINAGTIAITISGWDAAIKWPEGSSALASLAGFRNAIIKMRYVRPGTFVVTNTTIYIS